MGEKGLERIPNFGGMKEKQGVNEKLSVWRSDGSFRQNRNHLEIILSWSKRKG